MICGFLDTNGILYPCPKYGHISLAEKLVNKYNLKKTKHFELCEDVLLKNGWICIRTSDVYKRAYDKDGDVLFVTDAQQKFFEDHKEEFNKHQLADIEDMLKDFGKLYKFHKDEKKIEARE